MITVLYNILAWIFSILPDSPFQSMVDGVVYKIDFLPQLNWFVPFDNCSAILTAWLGCVAVYYVFVLVKKVVLDFLVEKLLSVVSVIGKGMVSGGGG